MSLTTVMILIESFGLTFLEQTQLLMDVTLLDFPHISLFCITATTALKRFFRLFSWFRDVQQDARLHQLCSS